MLILPPNFYVTLPIVFPQKSHFGNVPVTTRAPVVPRTRAAGVPDEEDNVRVRSRDQWGHGRATGHRHLEPR